MTSFQHTERSGVENLMTHKCDSQILKLLSSCQVTTFLWQSGKEMRICLLCERIHICIIRTPLPCTELSAFHFMVQQRLTPLQRHFVLVFQQKQYRLLLPSRQTVDCGYVFDQQHIEHLPLLCWREKEHSNFGGLAKRRNSKEQLGDS